MKAVMDTNVIVAALRSRNGASFEIFRRLRIGQWTIVVSNHLLFEYEEVLKRESAVLKLSLEDIDELLNAICARAQEQLLSPTWHPILSDSDDEPLVQLAVESESLRIVTHNTRHLQPALRFSVEVLNPREMLSKLRQQYEKSSGTSP
jgi:putative PIN family toxin of toxin-antitoxin system